MSDRAPVPCTDVAMLLAYEAGIHDARRDALRDAAAAIRAAGPATLKILPTSHTGEVVLIDLAERYAQMVEGLGQ